MLDESMPRGDDRLGCLGSHPANHTIPLGRERSLSATQIPVRSHVVDVESRRRISPLHRMRRIPHKAGLTAILRQLPEGGRDTQMPPSAVQSVISSYHHNSYMRG